MVDHTSDVEDIELYIRAVVSAIPASSKRVDSYRLAQEEDATCSILISYCRNGWPDKHSLAVHIQPYWKFQADLSLVDNLLLYHNRIVIPEKFQMETLKKLHCGHQGIQLCRLRARSSVWWLNISKAINNFVRQCLECQRTLIPHREPLITSPLPQHPWEKIASDLFHLNGHTNLIVVDYFSRYPEVVQMTTTTSTAVIKALKSIFSRHGIPSVFMSDNGPQFTSNDMKAFASSYGFELLTSSPHYPQSNSLVERTIKTVKMLLNDSPDPYLALLSPSQLPLNTYSLVPVQSCRVTDGTKAEN